MARMAPALFLLVTIFFWGTAFRASAIAADHASPIMITALRAGLAALALLLAVRRAAEPPAAARALGLDRRSPACSW